jgi:hypothetical protein
MLGSVLATFEMEYEEGLVEAEPPRLKELSESTVNESASLPVCSESAWQGGQS